MEFIENTFESPLKKIFTSLMGLQHNTKTEKTKLNITCHNEDFEVPAKWHFFATSHGKSACDGVGGTLKRLAAKASFQQPYNDQMMTPHQLYEWAQSSIHNLNFDFVTENKCEEEEGLLSSRCATAETVLGTQQLHVFMPVKKGVLNTKLFFASTKYTENHVISVLKDMIELKDITGFVTCNYGNFWWLGCVLSVSEESNDVKVSFLHPHGPSASYMYSAMPHILRLPQSAILAKVSRNTATGRTCALTSEETKLIAERSKTYICNFH
jgi:hypothetical protein